MARVKTPERLVAPNALNALNAPQCPVGRLCNAMGMREWDQRRYHDRVSLLEGFWPSALDISCRSPRPLMSSISGSPLTHFNAAGEAHMVDVAGKPATHRVARASGRITMQAETLALVRSGQSRKGDVLGVARIAAIQGAKRTADLIPLCHPLALTRVHVDFDLDEAAHCVHCTAQVETVGADRKSTRLNSSH